MFARRYYAGRYFPPVYWSQSQGEEAVIVVDDEYAGWPTRDFYSPYWMGMADPREVEQAAQERARAMRRDYDPVPSEAEQIITTVAREQAEADGDEIAQFIELNEAITRARLDWQDHYGGHLKALRDELKAAQVSRARVTELRERAGRQREAMEARARQVLEARQRDRRRQRILATALLLSAA